MPALQTAGSALPGNGDGFLRIGLDLAVSMFAPCLLGSRGTARQRPVPGGSGSRGLPHGPAGSSITRHQEVLSNTLSSGLLICGHIGPVAGGSRRQPTDFWSAPRFRVGQQRGRCRRNAPRFCMPDLRQSAWHLARSSTSGLRGLVIRACNRRRYTAGTRQVYHQSTAGTLTSSAGSSP
jgi:hypothetical protein